MRIWQIDLPWSSHIHFVFLTAFWKHLLRVLNSFSHSLTLRSTDCTTHFPYWRASGMQALKAIGYLVRNFVALPISNGNIIYLIDLSNKPNKTNVNKCMCSLELKHFSATACWTTVGWFGVAVLLPKQCNLKTIDCTTNLHTSKNNFSEYAILLGNKHFVAQSLVPYLIPQFINS